MSNEEEYKILSQNVYWIDEKHNGYDPSLKKDLENESEEMANSLKGNFGKRVIEAIKTEAEKMNDLSK